MRRLPALLLLTLALALLAVNPVSAAPAPEGTEVMIAVPGYLSVDGELDLVVFTNQASYTRTDIPFLCFLRQPGEVFEVRPMMMRDISAGQAGVVRNIITNEPFEAGTRLRGMTFLRECEVDGQVYRIYVGVTE